MSKELEALETIRKRYNALYNLVRAMAKRNNEPVPTLDQPFLGFSTLKQTLTPSVEQEEAMEVLHDLVNSDYEGHIEFNRKGYGKKYSTKDAIEKLRIVEKAIMQPKKELELYKEFVKEFGFEIIIENASNDYENWTDEYLDQSGATDRALELFKQIQQLEAQK